MIAAILALAILSLLPCPALAGDTAVPQITGVQVGVAGHYKAGLWTPVRVTIRGGSEALSGRVTMTVPDGDGVPSRVSTPADPLIRLQPGQDTTAGLLVRFGRTESDLTVEFLGAGDHVVARKAFRAGSGEGGFPAARASHRAMIVAVGADASGVEEAVASLQDRPDQRPLVVPLADFRQMPEAWLGYEGIDVVVLATSQPKACAGLERGSPQAAALDEWTQMGGKLVLSVGARAEEVLGDGAPLARFAPGKLQRIIPLRQASALETYAGGANPMPRLGAGSRLELRVAQLADVQGGVEAREGNLPLVVRRARGFGQVVFVAADLDAAPIRGWRDRGALARKLLGLTDRSSFPAQENAAVMHYGFDDLAGQLRSALDEFPGIVPASCWMIVSLVLAYLMLIGPIDYFFLNKVLRRMTLTWITFPLIVAAFCAGAYVLAYRLKEDRFRVNQVDLVDVDAASGRVRGTAWANVFSPKADRFDLAFEPRPLDPSSVASAAAVTSWLGLPGGGLGGMSPRTAAPVPWRQPYDFSPHLESVVGMPIPAWSTRSLTARWTQQAASPVEADLRAEDEVPIGAITNRLPFALSDCLLCYGRWVTDLGTIKPGQSVYAATRADRRDLTTFLTGRRLVIKEGRQLNTPYDRSSTDVGYILRAMMFFEVGRGRQYTGLFNRYQGFVDSSDLLGTNRAILIAAAPEGDAQGPQHGARLLCDGQFSSTPEDRHATIYRFVFPVKQAEP